MNTRKGDDDGCGRVNEVVVYYTNCGFFSLACAHRQDALYSHASQGSQSRLDLAAHLVASYQSSFQVVVEHICWIHTVEVLEDKLELGFLSGGGGRGSWRDLQVSSGELKIVGGKSGLLVKNIGNLNTGNVQILPVYWTDVASLLGNKCSVG